MTKPTQIDELIEGYNKLPCAVGEKAQRAACRFINENHAGFQAISELKAERDRYREALENAQRMCQPIIDGYPNADISHVDFRIRVTEWAEDLLRDDITKALGGNDDI